MDHQQSGRTQFLLQTGFEAGNHKPGLSPKLRKPWYFPIVARFRQLTLWLTTSLLLTGCTLADWLPRGKTQTDYQIADVTAFVNNVIKWLSVFAGLAIIFVMVAGYQYLMSAGSEEGVTRAKDTIRYAAVGMLFLVGGYGIVRVIAALLLNQQAIDMIFAPIK